MVKTISDRTLPLTVKLGPFIRKGGVMSKMEKQIASKMG